ncbi:putative non-specific serine/threonine protein kinase [Helianthus annuus]|nr:putative non-specific serine/threonine protein kinase [Helianthus annuus]
MLSTWGVGNDCCSWERVGCDDVTGRVVSLHLCSSSVTEDSVDENSYWRVYDDYPTYYYLVGDEMNSCLTELVNLEHLDLSGNYFLGSQIPDFIGSFKQLKYLNLSGAGFTGNIPHQIGNLSNLKVLDLSSLVDDSQELMTEDMAWISGLSKLEHLDLSGVDLSRAQNLNKLLYTLHSLLELSLSRCGLSMAYIGCNSSRELPSIKQLDLSQNDWKNRLIGKIPKCLMNMSLSVMLLGSNRLSGVITIPLGLNPSLLWLQLNDNNLNGELPQEFGYYKHLKVLDLGENKISGNIPDWIGENMTYLSALRLHRNNLIGRIPHSLCKSQVLRILDLAHNNLTGSIPRCFGELHGMTKNISYHVLKGVALEYRKTLQFVTNLDLSGNKLVGEIPETLTALDTLVGFNLSYNHFTGGIPRNIGNMKSLNSLDPSANKLTGTIPPSLGALNFLSHLNLSHNNLSGQIPTGNQLQTLIDPSIYADNPYLCGAPLPNECSPQKKPPTTTSKNKGGHANETKKVWFYLDIMSGFATGFWGIIGVLFFKKQWRHKLFKFCEEIRDKIYVAVAVRVLKMKRGREAS